MWMAHYSACVKEGMLLLYHACMDGWTHNQCHFLKLEWGHACPLSIVWPCLCHVIFVREQPFWTANPLARPPPTREGGAGAHLHSWRWWVWQHVCPHRKGGYIHIINNSAGEGGSRLRCEYFCHSDRVRGGCFHSNSIWGGVSEIDVCEVVTELEGRYVCVTYIESWEMDASIAEHCMRYNRLSSPV